VLGHQRQAIAFVGVIYRDDVDLGAQSRTSATHSDSKAKNGEATDDTNYSNVPGGPAAHPLRKNGSAIRIHLRLPLAGKLGWSAHAALLHDG
jgi:hypothetical protein